MGEIQAIADMSRIATKLALILKCKMDIKSVFIKVISGVIFTFILLLVLNELFGIPNDIQ